MTKIYIAVAGLVVLGLAFAGTYKLGERNGKNSVRAEIAEEVKRRLSNAQMADDAHTRCLANPDCRLRNDGFRRD